MTETPEPAIIVTDNRAKISPPAPAAPMTVVQCIAEVMRLIRPVGKSGKAAAAQGGYEFRRFDDIVNEIQPAMAKVGLVLLTDEILDLQYLEVETGKARTLQASVRVKIRYHLYGPGGDFVPVESIAEAMDSGDKATSKAMTVCYRTCLTQTFCLPTGLAKDPEEDVYTRSDRAPSGHIVGRNAADDDGPPPNPWPDRITKAISDGPDQMRAIWGPAYRGGAGDEQMARLKAALEAAVTSAAPAAGESPAPETADPGDEKPAHPEHAHRPSKAALVELNEKVAQWNADFATAVQESNPHDAVWDDLYVRADELPAEYHRKLKAAYNTALDAEQGEQAE